MQTRRSYCRTVSDHNTTVDNTSKRK
nr:unnamed protein product [Callosobruchus analis]